MWYFVWILAVLLSLATGLLAVMWVDVRSRPAGSTADAGDGHIGRDGGHA